MVGRQVHKVPVSFGYEEERRRQYLVEIDHTIYLCSSNHSVHLIFQICSHLRKKTGIFFQLLSNNTSCEFNLSRFLLQKFELFCFLSFMYSMCDAGIEIEWRIENQIKSNRSNEQKDFFCDCCCILFLSQPRIESFYYSI